jgi:hypothetical protein
MYIAETVWDENRVGLSVTLTVSTPFETKMEAESFVDSDLRLFLQDGLLYLNDPKMTAIENISRDRVTIQADFTVREPIDPSIPGNYERILNLLIEEDPTYCVNMNDVPVVDWEYSELANRLNASHVQFSYIASGISEKLFSKGFAGKEK